MAVERSCRGQGVGSHLFRATVDLAARIRPGSPLLLEVESDSGDGPKRREQRKRQEFYRRLGCRRIPSLAYRLPPHVSEQQPGMDLLVYAVAPTPSIPRLRVGEWLSEIYGQVYDSSPVHPRIAQMLGALPDPVPIA